MTEYSLEAFGKRIKEVRKELKMNQKEFAKSLDLSPSFISDIETGRSKACMDFFFRLASKHNISLYYLILGEGDAFGSSELRPSLGNKKIGHPIDNINELIWYLIRSPMLRNTVMGFTSKFIYENQGHLEREVKIYESDRE